MNDQRQVIFNQRLKILKSNSINKTLKEFFNEILEDFQKSITNYKKSNDEKYLTKIKNITGNSINDRELADLASKNRKEFFKDMNDLFLEKEKYRINIIGPEQNASLEKKIFLQIIDFSWRSHIQYLEQLRQVIGLRQYGQKDPLSEFKKEAFVLFEGLLSKIKNDLIKLLLNLNIVVSDDKKNNNVEKNQLKSDFKKVGRNDKCPCGSGKKYKYCHGNV